MTRLGYTTQKSSKTKSIPKSSEIPPTQAPDDYMDIDLIRTKKDQASVEGIVEGKIKIPILVDSCSGKSLMPDEIYKELELELDTSKITHLLGASTNTKSIGTVKNVKIEFAPGCTITEDFGVITNYPHRELLLSRSCLLDHNYDLFESRKHMAITCDGKDFFIPIIPTENERKKTNSPVLEALNN